MPQMDLSQLALLIPQLLLQAKGHPVTSAAFAEGWQKGLALREQEEQKRQATGRAEQQAQRQDMWTSAQIGNLQRDDARSEEQLRLNRAVAAFNALDKGFGGITEQSPDVTSAESAGLGLTRRVESMFGMPEASLAGEVGQIAPMVSARNKKRLKDTYKALESRWKDRGGLSALWESNPDVPIEGMGVLPFRQLVEMAGEAPTRGGTAMFPPETPESLGTSIEAQDLAAYADLIGKSPKQLTYQDRMNFRKSRSLADDKPAGAGGVSPGQSFQMSMRLSTEANKITQPIREMDRQLRMMKAGLAQAKAGNLNAGSQQILVTFQKILDPTSVVRESEYERSPQGQALLKHIEGIPQRITKGGPGVTVGELESFVAAAEAMMQNMRGWGDSKRKQLERLAKEYGLDPSLVFEDYEPVQDNNTDVLAQPAGASATTKPTAADLIRKYGGGQ